MSISSDKTPDPKGIQVLKPSLPKAGGGVQGIGERFAPNAFNGSASLSIPLPVSDCRGFVPALSLDYASGSGNGSFGLGWGLSLPEVSRRTALCIPNYTDADTFLLSGNDCLVPRTDTEGNLLRWTQDGYLVHAYMPRTASDFSCIERLVNVSDAQDQYWRVTNPENVVRIFGKSPSARVFDPQDPARVYKWLLEEEYNDKGEHIVYGYEKENSQNVPTGGVNDNRDKHTQAYLSKVSYGNFDPIYGGSIVAGETIREFATIRWHFQLVLDYGTYEITPTAVTLPQDATWPMREDAFSDYGAGFEIRTYRLCRNVLMFHEFEEIAKEPVVSSILQFGYDDSPILAKLVSFTQAGYQYIEKKKSYRSQRMPTLGLTYTPFAPLDNNGLPWPYKQFRSATGHAIPQVAEQGTWRLIDLYGKGVPGILYSDEHSVTFREPIQGRDGSLAYGEARSIPFPKGRVPLGPSHVLMDVTGDGLLDLMLQTPQLAGYFHLDADGAWQGFRAFDGFPSDFSDPRLAVQDMTGDGLADLLLIEAERLHYHPSLGGKGYAAAEVLTRAEDVPTSKPNSETEAIFFGEMIGSGLHQRVHVSNGSVSCWPNLGYGKFGKQVTMDNVPDFGDDFAAERIRWADLDGSGFADLIYIYPDHVAIYRNQSGNSFASKPIMVGLPTPWDDCCQIDFADVNGNGTTCMVVTYTHPIPQAWYYDFNCLAAGISSAGMPCHSQKPHLLSGIDNGMGAVTKIKYASSTTYRLADEAIDRPWITPMPFPVNVINSTEQVDQLSETSLKSTYRYSHGYYDSHEREFMGFARVDHIDAQSFLPFQASNKPEGAALAPPPLMSKTWYHTGAFLVEDGLMAALQQEYWQGDQEAYRMPGTIFDFLNPGAASEASHRSAHRSLKGAVLRSETYGNDSSIWQSIPYAVSAARFKVREVQALMRNAYNVVMTHEIETITYDYERNAADPMVQHDFILEIDQFGEVVRSCSVTYPRRAACIPGHIVTQTAEQQAQTWISYVVDTPLASPDALKYWNDLGSSTAPPTSGFLIGVPIESQIFQISIQAPLPAPYFSLSAIKELVAHSVKAELAQILHWERHYYYDALNAKELPLGMVTTPLLPHRTEFIAYTQSQLVQDFGFLPSSTRDALLVAGNEATHQACGGYFQPDAASDPLASTFFWNPGSAQSYFGLDHFFLPEAYFNPFQYPLINWQATGDAGTALKTIYAYDSCQLHVRQVVDPLGNTTTVTAYDYQRLQATAIEDLNCNVSSLLLDPLGRIIATSKTGTQAGGEVGFANLDDYVVLESPSIADIVQRPAHYLQGAASFNYYDLDAWSQSGMVVPTVLVELAYRDYALLNGTIVSPAPMIEISVAYLDGSGRPLQTKVYFDAPATVRYWDPETQQVRTTEATVCWLTSGAVRHDSGGHVIQQFEPFFARDFSYVNEANLNQVGHTITLFHDALGRNVLTRSAEGFFSKTLYGSLPPVIGQDQPLTKSQPDNTSLPLFGLQATSDSPSAPSALEPSSSYLNRKLYDTIPAGFTPTAWCSIVFDENDSILDSDYVPQTGANVDPDAWAKAMAFANTPMVHHENGLGHIIQSDQYNVPDLQHGSQYARYDIQGNLLTVADQRLQPQGLNNYRHDYNLTQVPVVTESVDAGDICELVNVLGQPLFLRDARGTQQFWNYDVLQRPDSHFVENSILQLSQIVRKWVYGDTIDMDATNGQNLRGKEILMLDESGLHLMPCYDIQGNVLLLGQWLKRDYVNEANWSGIIGLDSLCRSLQGCISITSLKAFALEPGISGLLDSERFVSAAAYAAIGELKSATDADGNSQVPEYYSNGWLRRLKVQGGAKQTIADPKITNILYNAHGQRLMVQYANGTIAKYVYDPISFEPMEINCQQAGSATNSFLKLYLHHDPVGNVTSSLNDNLAPIFFKNQKVDGLCSYTYDSLYHLEKATGREQIGMWANVQGNRNRFNSTYHEQRRPRLAQTNAMRAYQETYTYDGGGNLVGMQHTSGDNFSRTTTIATGSNRISTSSCGTLSPLTTYQYDPNGNLLQLGRGPILAYDYRNNLRCSTIIARPNHEDDAEYYVYNGAGERVRKVHVQQAATGNTVKEVIYLGGVEVRRSYSVGSSGNPRPIQREWHSVRLQDSTGTWCEWRYWIAGVHKHGEKAEQIRYQYQDILNSVIYELDESGKIITFEEYYPYGGTSLIAADSQRGIKRKHHHYSDKEKDNATGLYYYGMRYYAVWLGRWVSADPAGTVDGLNLYAFVGGNPITFSDHDGLVKTKIKGQKGQKKPTLSKAHQHLKTRRNVHLSARKSTLSTQPVDAGFNHLDVKSWNIQGKSDRENHPFELQRGLPDVLLVQEAGPAPSDGKFDMSSGLTTGTKTLKRQRAGYTYGETEDIKVNYVHVETGSKNLMILSPHVILNPHLVRIDPADDAWRFRPALVADVGGLRFMNLHLVSGAPNFAKKHLESIINRNASKTPTFLAGDLNMSPGDLDAALKNCKGIHSIVCAAPGPTHQGGGSLDHGLFFSTGTSGKISSADSSILPKSNSDHHLRYFPLTKGKRNWRVGRK